MVLVVFMKEDTGTASSISYLLEHISLHYAFALPRSHRPYHFPVVFTDS